MSAVSASASRSSRRGAPDTKETATNTTSCKWPRCLSSVQKEGISESRRYDISLSCANRIKAGGRIVCHDFCKRSSSQLKNVPTRFIQPKCPRHKNRPLCLSFVASFLVGIRRTALNRIERPYKQWRRYSSGDVRLTWERNSPSHPGIFPAEPPPKVAITGKTTGRTCMGGSTDEVAQPVWWRRQNAEVRGWTNTPIREVNVVHTGGQYPRPSHTLAQANWGENHTTSRGRIVSAKHVTTRHRQNA